MVNFQTRDKALASATGLYESDERPQRGLID